MKSLIFVILLAELASASPQTEAICNSIKTSPQGDLDIKIVSNDDPGHRDMYITYYYSSWEHDYTTEVWEKNTTDTKVIFSGEDFRLEIRTDLEGGDQEYLGRFFLGHQKPVDVVCLLPWLSELK